MTAIRVISALSAAPWGAAETLWHQAILMLRAQGHRVAASVKRWPVRPAPLEQLIVAGVELEEREEGLGDLWKAPGFDLTLLQQPDVFAAEPWMTALRATGAPYATLTHYGALHEWPPGPTALALRAGFAEARQNYFVAEASADLVERQTAQRLVRRQVVRAPYNVPYDARQPWPAGPLRLACVGRLDLEDKGQDVICHILAKPKWRRRGIAVSLVGDGPHRALVGEMISHLGLTNVRLAGLLSDIAGLWCTHHALILPSRAEGLPAAIVEAMLCGRPVLLTDVAGNAELVRDGVTGFVARTALDADVEAALERLWAARDRLPEMGAKAAEDIRLAVPPDPGSVFAEALLGEASRTI
jgi:glycosyltransferase involved in cell wall biosynthesis